MRIMENLESLLISAESVIVAIEPSLNFCLSLLIWLNKVILTKPVSVHETCEYLRYS